MLESEPLFHQPGEEPKEIPERKPFPPRPVKPKEEPIEPVRIPEREPVKEPA